MNLSACCNFLMIRISNYSLLFRITNFSQNRIANQFNRLLSDGVVEKKIPITLSNSFMECRISDKTGILNKCVEINSRNFQDAMMSYYKNNANIMFPFLLLVN